MMAWSQRKPCVGRNLATDTWLERQGHISLKRLRGHIAPKMVKNEMNTGERS
jgi:hypothetical protein